MYFYHRRAGRRVGSRLVPWSMRVRRMVGRVVGWGVKRELGGVWDGG